MEKPNKEKVRPVISFKIERNTLIEFENFIGDVEKTKAINNMIKYFLLPYNQRQSKDIIRFDFR